MHRSIVAVALVIVAVWHSTSASVVNPLLEEVIYTANQDAIKNHKDVVDVPALSHDGFLYKFQVKGGKAQNFSTLQLIGDDQVFIQTDGDGYSVFDLVLKVGLETVQVQLNYAYKFLHFFSGSGTMNISVGKNAVQPKLKITSYDNGTCFAVLESAVVTEVGDISIEFSPSTWSNYFLKHVLNFVGNHVVPHLLFVINSSVKDIVENKVPNSDFSKTVCKPLSP